MTKTCSGPSRHVVRGSWEAGQVPDPASPKHASHQEPGSGTSGRVRSRRHDEHHTSDTSDEDRDKTFASQCSRVPRCDCVLTPSQGLLQSPGCRSYHVILHVPCPSCHGELLQAHCSLCVKAARHRKLHVTANCTSLQTARHCNLRDPWALRSFSLQCPLICMVFAHVAQTPSHRSLPNDVSAEDGPRPHTGWVSEGTLVL